MRLLESILEANRRLVPGEKHASLDLAAVGESLPLAALTCIDARLNHILPEVLGIPEEKFIWLRNAGNIISGPLSSTLRSLALACLVKGAREIAIIGHTDCLVTKSTMLTLTDRLKELGIDRTRLPENLIEYFGVFASERQNVLKAVDTVRSSPLIGPRVAVHGLLVDLQTGRLESLANGYEAPVRVDTAVDVSVRIGGHQLLGGKLELPGFNLGEMKFPEFKIGELSLAVNTVAEPSDPIGQQAAVQPQPAEKEPAESPSVSIELPKLDWAHVIKEAIRYKVIGSDQKLYGPVTGRKLLEWIAAGHVDEQTPIQAEGSSMWQPLAQLAERILERGARHKDPPPVITPHPKLKRERR